MMLFASPSEHLGPLSEGRDQTYFFGSDSADQFDPTTHLSLASWGQNCQFMIHINFLWVIFVGSSKQTPYVCYVYPLA